VRAIKNCAVLEATFVINKHFLPFFGHELLFSLVDNQFGDTLNQDLWFHLNIVDFQKGFWGFGVLGFWGLGRIRLVINPEYSYVGGSESDLVLLPS